MTLEAALHGVWFSVLLGLLAGWWASYRQWRSHATRLDGVVLNLREENLRLTHDVRRLTDLVDNLTKSPRPASSKRTAWDAPTNDPNAKSGGT